MTHTPGPWKLFTTPDGGRIVGIGDVNAEGVTDCGFGLWRDGPEMMANAQLIAAAPDLLEALEGIMGLTVIGDKIKQLDKGIGTATPDGLTLLEALATRAKARQS